MFHPLVPLFSVFVCYAVVRFFFVGSVSLLLFFLVVLSFICVLLVFCRAFLLYFFMLIRPFAVYHSYYSAVSLACIFLLVYRSFVFFLLYV